MAVLSVLQLNLQNQRRIRHPQPNKALQWPWGASHFKNLPAAEPKSPRSKIYHRNRPRTGEAKELVSRLPKILRQSSSWGCQTALSWYLKLREASHSRSRRRNWIRAKIFLNKHLMAAEPGPDLKMELRMKHNWSKDWILLGAKVQNLKTAISYRLYNLRGKHLMRQNPSLIKLRGRKSNLRS